jgi:hypothetical protein
MSKIVGAEDTGPANGRQMRQCLLFWKIIVLCVLEMDSEGFVVLAVCSGGAKVRMRERGF